MKVFGREKGFRPGNPEAPMPAFTFRLDLCEFLAEDAAPHLPAGSAETVRQALAPRVRHGAFVTVCAGDEQATAVADSLYAVADGAERGAVDLEPYGFTAEELYEAAEEIHRLLH